jgi:hypothetical protein
MIIFVSLQPSIEDPSILDIFDLYDLFCLFCCFSHIFFLFLPGFPRATIPLMSVCSERVNGVVWWLMMFISILFFSSSVIVFRFMVSVSFNSFREST